MMRSSNFGHAFGFAWQGLRYVVHTQANARIHLTIALLVLVVGLPLRLPAVHWAVLTLVMGLVFCAEMTNTVVEAVVDLVTQEYHPLAKTAKDVAAGTVLVAAGVAVIVGLLILGPPLLNAVESLVNR